MKIALCNEVIREMPFAEQCVFAAELGYDGIELAPFTVSDNPHLLSKAERAGLRRAAADAGIEIVSLHWLLLAPEGLSITSADAAVRARTVDVMQRLIGLCHELGGSAMVHGSPAQRNLPAGNPDEARAWAIDCFGQVAPDAEAAGVTYCIEALSTQETNFITSIAEAAEIVDRIGSPALRTMLDTCAAGKAEAEAPAALIDRWLPSGHIAHVQVNDRNHRGPGQGEQTFAPVFAALRRHAYDGIVAVEPFDYVPDGPAAAARAIGYIRGILEGLA
jgi:sugar phosphate isomerase/epimerase